MLCPYFGRWPAWINFFVESCKWNRDVYWRLYTDCGAPENRAENVECVPMTFADYKALVSARLGITFDPENPYKLCDLRPALGFLHAQDAADFSFFGYGDLDVIYGDISRFYGGARLADFDVVSAHWDRLSGHFAVFRNTPALRHAFERIPDYRALLEMPQHSGVDERQYSRLFRETDSGRALFFERYSTILNLIPWHNGRREHPQRWFWRRGHLTNDRDGASEFLYLHFMRWQSARWINNPPVAGEAAWVGRDIIHVDWRAAGAEGFCISPSGFTPIDQTVMRGAEASSPAIVTREMP